MDAQMALPSEARVHTTVPRRYLAQLCKHFQHRLPVTFDEDHGRIEFPAGICTLAAEDETLVLCAAAADEEALAQVQDVAARHLERFAFREKTEIRWTRIMMPAA